MKIGDIVKEKNNGRLGIIISKYDGHEFDWEVFAIKRKFGYGHTWQDCFKEEKLENYDWKDYPITFFEKLKLLFRW